MKKTRSTTLRRAWPSSDFSDRATERTRSRSEKDYRLYKHYPKPFITHLVSHSPRIYMPTAGINEVDNPLLGAQNILWCPLSNVPHADAGNSFVSSNFCSMSAASALWLSIWQPEC
ncbi:storkhead-box protein 2 isoform X2 [Tachysurus ichikawai]